MHVDAASYSKGGKSKNGGMDSKGGGKSKGKDGKGFGKNKGKDGKSRGKGSSSSGSSMASSSGLGTSISGRPAQFQGECGYCWKWGHKRADCRKRLADKASVGAVTEAGDSGGTGHNGSGEVSVATYACDTIYENDGDRPGFAFCCLVGSQHGSTGGFGDGTSLLLDSGSDEHMCDAGFVAHLPLRQSTGPKLQDIQRRPLPTQGVRDVEVKLGHGAGVNARVPFTVGNVHMPVVSVGNLGLAAARTTMR